tara:strand:- start:7987 stop:8277 length:291 start_codon:yes stop_codon:yes gene_type:complete
MTSPIFQNKDLREKIFTIKKKNILNDYQKYFKKNIYPELEKITNEIKNLEECKIYFEEELICENCEKNKVNITFMNEVGIPICIKCCINNLNEDFD